MLFRSGIASSEQAPDASADQLLCLADEALYRAKTTGRNRSEVSCECFANTYRR